MADKRKLKKYIVVSHEPPKFKKSKKHPHMIRDITHIVEKSESAESDSSYHDDIIEHLFDMEKDVINIINNNQKSISIACDCFKALKTCLTKK